MEQLIFAKSRQAIVGHHRGMYEAAVTTPVNHEFIGGGVSAQKLKMRRSLDPSGEIVSIKRWCIKTFYRLEDLLVFIARQKFSPCN